MIVKETKEYIIRKIPLNYRIDIKRSLTLKNPSTRIERDWYEDIEHPLQDAIDLAERVCREYFTANPHFIDEAPLGEQAR